MAKTTVTHGGNIFAVARERGWDWREIVDFSASINPLGPSPRVREAICSSIERITHYPDREPIGLQAALAEAWSVNAEQILCGNGATELISFAARVFGEQKVALAVPVFSEFHRFFPTADCVQLERPQEWPRDGLVVATRPANPTGWILALADLEAYLAVSQAIVLVDESFIEFTCATSAACLLANHPRLVILRSLTKFYALPGLRLGALIGNEKRIRSWRSVREPWQVNVLAEAAGIAAIQDREHAKASLQLLETERAWLFEKIVQLPKTDAQPSDANYLFIRLDYSAAALTGYLLERKILVRNCTGWPGVAGEGIRIAVRTRAENERLLRAWEEFPCT